MSEPRLKDPETALVYGVELLLGDRVSLRPSTAADFEALADWWLLPGWAVLQQPTFRPRTRAAVIDMFAQWSRNDSASGAGFSIENAAGDLVGHVTVWGVSAPLRIATYAIVLGPDFVDHGYGTDATKVMVRYAFDELGAHKVELQTWDFNARAIRAYEKAGFVIEGVRRAATFHAGEFYDEVLMGVVVEDYRSHD